MISHYHAWKKCIELDQNIVVLEHDSRVCSDSYTQDFDDVLHLDGYRFEIYYKCFHFIILSICGLDGYRFEQDPNEGKTPVVEDFVHMRKGETQLKGTYGYVIKPHAAKRLIQGAHEDGLTASDMFVKDKYVCIQVVKPRAVYVASQDSLTSNRSFYI